MFWYSRIPHRYHQEHGHLVDEAKTRRAAVSAAITIVSYAISDIPKDIDA